MGPGLGKGSDPGFPGNHDFDHYFAHMKQLYDFFFFCTNVKFFLKMLLFHPGEKPAPGVVIVIVLL